MAFVVHTLPPAPRQNATRRPPTCNSSGQVSVSRRRRVFEFLQQAVPSAPSTTAPVSDAAVLPAAAPSAPPAPSASPLPPAPTPEQRAAAAAAVAERFLLRQISITQDAERKRQQWVDEIAQLRTPPKIDPPAVEPVSTVSPPATLGAVSSRSVSPTPQATSSTPEAGTPATTSSTPETETPAYVIGTPSAAVTTPSSAEGVQRPIVADVSGVIDSVVGAASGMLGSNAEDKPPEKKKKGSFFNRFVDRVEDIVEDIGEGVEDVVEDISESVENIVEGAEDIVEDITEGVQDFLDGDDDDKAIGKDDADKADDAFVDGIMNGIAENAGDVTQGITQEQADKILAADDETEGIQKTIGEKLLDAIVKGVEPSSSDTEVGDVDKTELIELVESGKVKNLTVTKLRRLLSANGLKTSGRKSELIARLTSFANAK